MLINLQNNIEIENKKKTHHLEITGPLGRIAFVWKKYDLNCDYSYRLLKDQIALNSLQLTHLNALYPRSESNHAHQTHEAKSTSSMGVAASIIIDNNGSQTKTSKLTLFLDSSLLGALEQKKQSGVKAKRMTPLGQSRQWSCLPVLAQKIQGVSRGYFVYLRVVGVGYRVFLSQNILTFKLGFSHFYKVKVPKSTRVFLPEPTLLCLYGIDKNQVTQVAASIKRIKPPSVYKGKGIKLLKDSIRLKEGKKKS
uniref:Ribosomal protein L6 n=1 Tax=Scherffelia dubia TaxID=3190 RepID=A0A650ARA4_SCHDU|nr:ribosomal protein L6 [Scherffelia dubia]QGP70678.1 ribosomal protein L6 [Scherffelia dubia]